MTRSMVSTRSASRAPQANLVTAAIIADFRASMGELKCMGSERMVRQGISMSQLHVLHLLEHHGDMTMSQLAEMIDVSDSNATGLVDRVEERGFVERTRVPTDRRIVMVQLTSAGRQTLSDLEDLREQVLRRVLDQLDARQLAGVAEAMADLRAAVVATAMDPVSDAHHHSHVAQGRV